MARTLHARTFRAGRVGIPKAHGRHGGTRHQARRGGTHAAARHHGAAGGHHATHASSHATHRAKAPRKTRSHTAAAWGAHTTRSHKGGAHTRHGTRRNLLGGWQGPALPEDVQVIQQDDPFADPFSGGIDPATNLPVLDEMSPDGGLPFTDATH